jgi:hypothetical protein
MKDLMMIKNAAGVVAGQPVVVKGAAQQDRRSAE